MIALVLIRLRKVVLALGSERFFAHSYLTVCTRTLNTKGLRILKAYQYIYTKLFVKSQL